MSNHLFYSTYLNPIDLYISIALGKSNILHIIKLYNSSNKNNDNKNILNIKNFFFVIILDKYIQKGTITYISNNPEIAKNNTLLKHVYPPILPKFHISTL